MNKDTFSAALTKEVCPVCLKEQDGPIIMNSVLTEKHASEVNDLNGKVIGYSEKPCKDCIESLDGQEGVFLIGMDPSKTTGNKIEDIYRSGNVTAIKLEAFKRLFKSHPVAAFGLDHGFTFVDQKILDVYFSYEKVN